MFLSAGLTQGALGIGYEKEAEGRGAGGRGENSPPLLPALSSPPTP
jgi:hypothetical protein